MYDTSGARATLAAPRQFRVYDSRHEIARRRRQLGDARFPPQRADQAATGTDDAEPSPRVSAVILAFNRPDALDLVIARLADLPLDEIVVMNAGERGGADVARRDPRVTLVEADNVGIANRNLGAAQATGELAADARRRLLSPPGAVEAMREAFARSPALGALGGFVRDVDEAGRLDAAVGPGSFDWFLRAGREGEPADGIPAFFFPRGRA